MEKILKSKAQRDSGIELLRIVSMLMIIANHYVTNSGLTSEFGPILADPTAPRSIFLLLFGAWGKTFINSFVLITGYFMCKSQITAKKYFKLLFEVIFYKVLTNTILGITGMIPFSFVTFVKSWVPFTSLSTSFTACFLVFFLFIPFLNITVRALTKKQHLYLMLLLGSVYVLFGTMPFMSITMNYVSWFIVLYFIASYIRLHPHAIFDNHLFWGILTVISLTLSSASIVICASLTPTVGRNISYLFVTDSNTFLALLTGLSFFMFFKTSHIKYNKFINFIAQTMFGVLLIHAHNEVLRRWLWRDILNVVGHYSSKFLVLHSIISVIGIFVVCVIIDLARIYFIEKPFFKIWDPIWNKVSKKFLSLENKFFKEDT